MLLKGPYNFVRGNLQQNPPPTPEYFHKDIFLSEIPQLPVRDID